MLEFTTNGYVKESRVAAAMPQTNTVPTMDSPVQCSTGQVHWARHLPDVLGNALAKLKQTSAAHSFRTSGATEQSSGIRESIEPAIGISQAPKPQFIPSDVLRSRLAESGSKSTLGNHQVLPKPRNSTDNKTENDSGDERRQFPRRRSECRFALLVKSETVGLTPQQVDWLLGTSCRHHGRVLDISQYGLCLQMDTLLAPGIEVVLRISNSRLKRTVDISAEVLYCRPAGNGLVTVHCRVDREFTLDQLQDLGQPKVGHNPLG